jgi:hypothetical protein
MPATAAHSWNSWKSDAISCAVTRPVACSRKMNGVGNFAGIVRVPKHKILEFGLDLAVFDSDLGTNRGIMTCILEALGTVSSRRTKCRAPHRDARDGPCRPVLQCGL